MSYTHRDPNNVFLPKFVKTFETIVMARVLAMKSGKCPNYGKVLTNMIADDSIRVDGEMDEYADYAPFLMDAVFRYDRTNYWPWGKVIEPYMVQSNTEIVDSIRTSPYGVAHIVMMKSRAVGQSASKMMYMMPKDHEFVDTLYETHSAAEIDEFIVKMNKLMPKTVCDDITRLIQMRPQNGVLIDFTAVS